MLFLGKKKRILIGRILEISYFIGGIMKKLILLLNILLISVMFAKTTDKVSGRNDDIMKMQKNSMI